MGKARSPRRDAHCGGRLHGTNRMPGSTATTCVAERSLARSIQSLHHRQMVPGERAARLCVANEEVRVFTTWISKSPLFPASVAQVGLETKNPSGALAREGFDLFELWKGVTPFLPRESACTGNPVRSTRCPISDCRSCVACRRSRFSRATIAPRRVRCMIATHMSVKLRAEEFFVTIVRRVCS